MAALTTFLRPAITSPSCVPVRIRERLKPHFRYFLAPHPEERAGIDAHGIEYGEPNRVNIISAFRDLFGKADPQRGDFCLLYYSGHGSQIEAPAAFSEVQPNLIFQTLVLRESPTPGYRDLIDKELGFLIAEAMQDKAPDTEAGVPGVHFLTIMDCCHSGSNTRDENNDIKVRQVRSSPSVESASDILGFDPNGNFYYKALNDAGKIPRGGILHARHISLAAARDAETAKEKRVFADDKLRRHGIFTYCLLKTLQQVGTHLSYAELIRRVKMEVGRRMERQIPVLTQTIATDENLLFLDNLLKTPEQEYEVIFRDEKWFINAGALHGIIPSKPGRLTTVKLRDRNQQERSAQAPDRTVRITRVKAAESLLDSSAFTKEDRFRMLNARIDQMEVPAISVGPDPELPESMLLRLKELFAEDPFHYLEWEENGTAEFLIRTRADRFILTRADGSTPLFDGEANAASFLKDADKVGKWFNVLNMESGHAQAFRERKDHFRVDAWKLEGVDFGPGDFNDIPASAYEQLPPNPKALELNYRPVLVDGEPDDLAPAFRLRISLTKAAKYEEYWVGALYLNSAFGISHHYGPVQRLSVDESNKFMDLNYRDEHRTYEGFPVMLSKDYHALGITEITSYVIFFISNKEFSLDQYYQPSLPLFSSKRPRNEGFEQKKSKKDFWFTIKIPVRLHRPVTEVPLQGGMPQVLPAMTVRGPVGFSATAQTISNSTARQSSDADTTAHRSAAPRNPALPNPEIWMNAATSDAIFSPGRGTTDRDEYISILELRRAEGTVNESSPLRIKPAEPVAVNETIVPFAYDAENHIYYPVGHTDQEGEVVINRLPPPSPGILATREDQRTERGVRQSTKLFFKKLIWSNFTGDNDYHRLSLVYRDEQGWIRRHHYHQDERLSDLTPHGNTVREIIGSLAEDDRILLLVHGLMDNTREMEYAIFNRTDLSSKFAAVLTFNYENLHTSISEAGEVLAKMLRECGVSNQQNITVVAHSTGGLIARWFIEHAGGARWVDRFIQVGTPNGGTELAKFRQKALDGLMLALNGIKKLEPFLTIGSFIFKGLDNLYFRSVNQLVPGSKVLLTLNSLQKKRPALPTYHLIAGNTGELEALVGERASRLKKFLAEMIHKGKYHLLDKAVFEDLPNDWMVLIDSMKEVPGGHDTYREVSSDHFSYFQTEEGLKALSDLLLH